jgi:multidrug resistance protein, MATE family
MSGNILSYLRSPSLGPWHRRVWQLSLPIMLSNASTPLLGMVDTAVVGHLDSPHYLGAVALGSMIISLLFWAFGFLRMGTTGMTAQSRGAGDHDEVRAHLARALLLALGFGVLLILLQYPLAQLSFAVSDASDEVSKAGQAYFSARIWGAPQTLANYALMGWFLAMNRTGYILFQQLFLNGANIVFDLFFVLGLDMNAAGVGYASTLAETSACLLGLLLVRRLLRTQPGQLHASAIMDRNALKRLLAVNGDIMIRTFCLQAGFLWFTAQGGQISDITLAANAVLIQLQTFTSFALDGFAFTAETLSGEAKGARNRKHLDAAVAVSSLWAFAFSLALSLIYLLAGKYLIHALTGIEEVRSIAFTFLPYAIVLPVISVASFQLDGVFIGTTEGRSLRNAMLVSLVVFLVAGYLLMPLMGNHGLWLAFTIFMAMRGLTLGIAYPRLRAAIPEAAD